MKLTWLGHSCFLLESGGFRLVIDPYQDVPGLPDVQITADAVYCSHGHFDHAYCAGVQKTEGKQTPFSIQTVASFHDAQSGALRGENTIHCFTAEGLTVVHLGDLGHPLNREQLAAIGACDVLLLPIGGTYTIDAAEAKHTADALAPTVIVPMHYRLGQVGFPELDTLEKFTALYPEQMLRSYSTSTLDLSSVTEQQIALLSLPNQ